MHLIRHRRGGGRDLLRRPVPQCARRSRPAQLADDPGGPAGAALLVEFTLAGQSFQALNGGERIAFTHALSLSLDCVDQAGVDRIWDAFPAAGGEEVECGWIKDPWGVSWQIIPAALPRLLADRDPAVARRAMQAMLPMKRIDAAAIERAAAG